MSGSFDFTFHSVVPWWLPVTAANKGKETKSNRKGKRYNKVQNSCDKCEARGQQSIKMERTWNKLIGTSGLISLPWKRFRQPVTSGLIFSVVFHFATQWKVPRFLDENVNRKIHVAYSWEWKCWLIYFLFLSVHHIVLAYNKVMSSAEQKPVTMIDDRYANDFRLKDKESHRSVRRPFVRLDWEEKKLRSTWV